MKVTEQSTYRLMQANLNRISTDLQELQYQGATGLKLNKPSDDPSAIRPVLNTRSSLRETERYLETMGQTADKMAATDSSLAQVENIMVRAKEIAISGANTSLSAADKDILADEIAQLKKELLSTANASVDGKYVFAGYSENTIPFVENPAYDPALYNINDVNTWPVLYQGDYHPTQLEITPGEFIEVNLTGNELFLGITNEIAATGSTVPYQGQSITSAAFTPGPFADDITVTAGSNPAVVISGADLIDGALQTNYAGNVVAGLFNLPGTGLIATANSATANLGPLALSGFNESESDTYTLDITSGGTTVSVTLDGPSNNFDYTLNGLSFALANSVPAPTSLTATSGTLANGVSYDIASGSLVLTGPADGSEIELVETVTDTGVLAAAGGITGGSQTIYGTINIAPDSTDDVVLSGAAGLANVGLGETTLNGATSNIDLFNVLTRLEEALRADNINDPSGAGGGIAAQIDSLEIAADQNRKHRAILGTKAAHVDTAIQYQEDAQIDLRQILSRYEDANIIQVYNDIIQKESAFEAALNITGRISQVSILSYF